MEVTKEQVLESMNTYCTERKYGSESLTDGFKEKFSNFIVKKYEGKDVEEEDFKSDLHFNLDTAFSASVDLKTSLTAQFATKENEYKNQITELNKKIATPQQPQQKYELPEDVKNQLAELEKFKTEQSKQSKRKEILEMAKQNIQQSLHGSFENFIADTEVLLDKDSKEQADALVAKYQKVMQPTYGSIKPLAPRQVQKRDEEILGGIKEVKVC
jgi:hypothetical protein